MTKGEEYHSKISIEGIGAFCCIFHGAKGWIFKIKDDNNKAVDEKGFYDSPQCAARAVRQWLKDQGDPNKYQKILWRDRGGKIKQLELMLSPKQEDAARKKGYLDKTCPKCSGTGKFTRGNANSPDGKSTSPCPRCFEIGRLWGKEEDWERDSRRIANQLKSDQDMARILGE